ncbi:hypothetical protein GCM10025883_27520 [Mobilicoccus caccae]|uniref:Bacterial sugar transferase domain-containing protein n=1 Tax=Mobilicoccus caccae TaxID=1859295 RepID=A0ABQ6IS21_9MICO|nr:hypothetical protein GCM10025883_27520 [Mobilicoccus caccae]
MRRLFLADAAIGVLAATCAATVRFDGAVPDRHVLLSVSLPIAWVLAVSLGNGYERRFVGQAGAEEYRAIGRALLYLFAGLSIVSYAGDLQLSRGYMVIALGVLTVGGLCSRKVIRRRLAVRRRAGECLQRTLVVGRSDSVSSLVDSVTTDRSLGLLPVAACAVDLAGRPMEPGSEIAGVPVVGAPLDAVAAVDLLGVEAVAVASHPDLAGTALRRLAWALEERGGREPGQRGVVQDAPGPAGHADRRRAGEMSLVGPRPPLPSEVLAYESDAIRRLHVRPGMTGLWQVSGRSDLSWDESLKLDLRYVDNWSPITDLWILLRTVRAVFGHHGAY